MWVHLQNAYKLHLSLYWLPEAQFYTMVASTFIGSGLLEVYKKYADIFSKELASMLQQNSKYGHAIDLEEG